jgi:hypothetical protein
MNHNNTERKRAREQKETTQAITQLYQTKAHTHTHTHTRTHTHPINHRHKPVSFFPAGDRQTSGTPSHSTPACM